MLELQENNPLEVTVIGHGMATRGFMPAFYDGLNRQGLDRRGVQVVHPTDSERVNLFLKQEYPGAVVVLGMISNAADQLMNYLQKLAVMGIPVIHADDEYPPRQVPLTESSQRVIQQIFPLLN